MSGSNPTDELENTNEISLADQTRTDATQKNPRILLALLGILLCLIALLILGIFLLRSSFKLFQGDTQPIILETSSPLEINY